MKPEDVEGIVRGEREQGWNAAADKYEMRLRERDEGKAIAFLAEYKGHIAGYITDMGVHSACMSSAGISLMGAAFGMEMGYARNMHRVVMMIWFFICQRI
ncbi:MAG: hypothetical protein NC314_01265 [Roseburia sp.]|nr:hypothetical protein [Roseburia sp.]MCM1241443.1 hypothetical protein [Roseburia sp.]